MPTEHRYTHVLTWTGSADGPTGDYASYSRRFRAVFPGSAKPPIDGSADPTWRGDPALHNPEDLLLLALSSCHMLSLLAHATKRRILVTGYTDQPEGVMSHVGHGYQFTRVILRPRITLSPGSPADHTAALPALHGLAHHDCFIARSVNFPVIVEPAD